MTLALSLPFKGERTYLHGTDMYDGTLAALADKAFPIAGRVRLRINQVTRTAVDLLVSQWGEKVTRPEREAASLVVGETAAFLVATDRPVTHRVPYDDAATDAAATIDGDAIRLAAAPRLTSIEALVAITRTLHRTRLPSPGRRWMFTGLDAARPLVAGDAGGATVTLETRLGVALTKSAIVTGSGERLGHIYFSLVDP